MHFALICPPFRSHIAVFEALGTELVRRGHRATFILNEGAERYVTRLEAGTVPGVDPEELQKIIASAARPNGLFGILRTVADTAGLSDRLCQHAPDELRALGIDAILGDQMEPAAGLIARHLNMPMLSIACALPIERDDLIPLPFLPWNYDASERGAKRNRGGERVAWLLLTAQRRMISTWSDRFGLMEPCRDLQDCLSPLGTISQTTEAFDFPRHGADRKIYPVGPIRPENEEGDLPFAVNADKPFVFMSLGTLQGHRYRLFKLAAAACRDLGVQLLVAHCGGLMQRQAEALGATWATDFVPQRAALRRADLCITHGGLNTVMDALEFGKPLLALPIAFDQPGVAARIVHHGAGLKLSRHFLSVSKMRTAIRTLLEDGTYRRCAAQLGRSIGSAGGLHRAADTIENVFNGRAP